MNAIIFYFSLKILFKICNFNKLRGNKSIISIKMILQLGIAGEYLKLHIKESFQYTKCGFVFEFIMPLYSKKILQVDMQLF